MRARIAAHHELSPVAGDASAVGKTFSLKGHQASVSFVTSMTESFCGTCSRLRLTADGHIKSCLFHPAEKNLRDVMRDGGNDEELRQVIRGAVYAKPAAHPPVEELMHIDNRAMISIGG